MHQAPQRDLRAAFGEAVRRRRAELGLTQAEVADRMGEGVDQSDVSRIEGGSLPWPRFDLMGSLAHALELTTFELLRQSGWMSDEDYHTYHTADLSE